MRFWLFLSCFVNFGLQMNIGWWLDVARCGGLSSTVVVGMHDDGCAVDAAQRSEYIAAQFDQVFRFFMVYLAARRKDTFSGCFRGNRLLQCNELKV